MQIYHLDARKKNIDAFEYSEKKLIKLPTNINKDKIFEMLKEAYNELSICMPSYLASDKYDFVEDINQISIILCPLIGFIEYYEIKSCFSDKKVFYIDLISAKRGYGKHMMNVFKMLVKGNIELKSIYYAINFYIDLGFIPIQDKITFQDKSMNIKEYIKFVKDNKNKNFYYDYPYLWMKLNNI